MAQAPQDARLHPRVAFSKHVNVVATASAPPLKLQAINLGPGGMCVQTAHPFRRGDRVGVRIRAAGEDLAIHATEVAWVVRPVKGGSRVPAIGLRFLQVSPIQRMALKRALSALQNGSLAPLPPAGAAPVPPHRQYPKPISEKPMHGEPSLLPLDAAGLNPSLLPQIDPVRTDPDSNGPSLAPLSEAPAISDEPSFVFSTDPRPLRSALSGPSMGLAGGLLVVGTLAGVIFGVMDQRGQPEKPVAEAAAPLETAPAPPVAEAAAVAPAPSERAPAASPTPAPRSVPPARAAAPAARPARAAARAAPVESPAVALPHHRPGQISLGAVSKSGHNLLVPVRGVRKVVRSFALKAPDRFVVDLDAENYEGPAELPGTGKLLRARLGRHAHGIRLVLDLTDAKAAAGATVERRGGVTTVVVPLR